MNRLKVPQNSQENTCVGVYFKIKLKISSQHTLLKKETQI